MTRIVAPLPSPAPTSERDTTQAFLQAFAQRYGDTYLRLAYYAAFPLALTSDMLYRLWAMLCQDETDADNPIPYGAVAKLLVGTGLCRTVGDRLYQIDPDLRQALLHALEADPRFGAPRLQDLAAFTLSYAEQQQHHPDSMVQDFAQVQRWGALAYCHTPQAAQELAQALAHAYAVDRDDLYRMAKVVLTLADPLKDYPTLLSYARGMERLACDDEAGALEHLKELLQSRHSPTIEGVTLPLPTLQPDPKHRKPRSKPPLNWLRWVPAVAGVLTAVELFVVGSVLLQSVLVQRTVPPPNSVVARKSPNLRESSRPSPSPTPSSSPTSYNQVTPPSPPPASPVAPNPEVTDSNPTSRRSSTPSPIPPASSAPAALPPTPTSSTPSVSPTSKPATPEAGTGTSEGTPSLRDKPVIPVEPKPGGTPGEQKTPASIPTTPPSPSKSPEPLPPNLRSALDSLKASLQKQDFLQADQQTSELLLKMGDKDKSGWLSQQELENLSCDAIQVIDREWSRASKGRFGFSVQVQIWREVGSPNPIKLGEGTELSEATMEPWIRFSDRVGWRTNGRWLSDLDILSLDPSLSPEGMYPLVWERRVSGPPVQSSFTSNLPFWDRNRIDLDGKVGGVDRVRIPLMVPFSATVCEL